MRTAERPQTATLVFVLLVVATVAAFFVTQRLKRSSPVVRHVMLPLYISPNGDGRKDTAVIRFRLPKADDRVTVSMVDANGDEVRRLADRRMSKGRHHVVWNGRDSSAAILRDGFYYLRVVLSGQGRGTIARRGIHLVTAKPVPKLLTVSPARIHTGGREPVTIKFSGPANPAPVFSVYRTDAGPPRLVQRFAGAVGSTSGTWDGRIGGRPAPAGTYAFAVTVENRALVAGSAPQKLPPTAAGAQPNSGVTIGGLVATAPLDAVPAGRGADITVGGATGRVRFALTPLGGGRPLRRGVGQAPVLRIAVPGSAATGVYMLRLSAGAGAARVPVAVRGRSAAARVLVVLPAITWQGLNGVDDDADGFPDTLDDARSIPVSRPLAGGRPPARFGSEVAPLIGFLASNHLRYDITTDVALAAGRGPGFGGHRGVAFAGSERWFTEELDRRLRAYVEHGGRVASFGTDALRRTVTLTTTRLADPGPPQETNVLGEQTGAASSAAAPLVVNPGDTLALFSGTDGFVGLFTRFEQSRRRVAGAKVEASAGRDPSNPAFVAYTLGRGLVVRTGTPQWSRMLATDTEVAAVTKSLWSLLSR
jgi:N,N-dimethylformamidase beta subunit-like protein/flagellar hook capping protein FlgD